MTLRTERNACILIVIVWSLIAVGQAPSFTHYDIYVLQEADGEERSLCINLRHAMDDGHAARVRARLFYMGIYWMESFSMRESPADQEFNTDKRHSANDHNYFTREHKRMFPDPSARGVNYSETLFTDAQ